MGRLDEYRMRTMTPIPSGPLSATATLPSRRVMWGSVSGPSSGPTTPSTSTATLGLTGSGSTLEIAEAEDDETVEDDAAAVRAWMQQKVWSDMAVLQKMVTSESVALVPHKREEGDKKRNSKEGAKRLSKEHGGSDKRLSGLNW
jgi:predicted ABC-type transport system involved in lysophospholipase L1 biosynthesis ATPase subunit